MRWGVNPAAVLNPDCAAEAQRFMTGFIRGRAGAMGFGPTAVTNLIARSEWYERQTQVAFTDSWIQGQTIRPGPAFASPTAPPHPMRASDVARVYQSQLLQIQDYLIGTP